jgi:TrmH family RNA methyltransferase
MKEITSRENARYRAMAKLVASAAERRKSGLTILDGVHLLAAFLDSGRSVHSVVVSRVALERPEIADLAARCSGAPVIAVPEKLFAPLSTVESPTGIIAAVRTPAAREVPRNARLVLLLEDLQDPGNVGTLLRSAAATGAEHVLLSGTCAFAWSPKVLRAAMGAHFALNIVEGADLAAFVTAFSGTSVALAATAQSTIYDLDLRAPAAILVGNEGAGLSPGLLRAATVRGRIPMRAGVESLNAAVAGSLCLFEAVRQRSRGSPYP